jgi:hypothetical protein
MVNWSCSHRGPPHALGLPLGVDTTPAACHRCACCPVRRHCTRGDATCVALRAGCTHVLFCVQSCVQCLHLHLVGCASGRASAVLRPVQHHCHVVLRHLLAGWVSGRERLCTQFARRGSHVLMWWTPPEPRPIFPPLKRALLSPPACEQACCCARWPVAGALPAMEGKRGALGHGHLVFHLLQL